MSQMNESRHIRTSRVAHVTTCLMSYTYESNESYIIQMSPASSQRVMSHIHESCHTSKNRVMTHPHVRHDSSICPTGEKWKAYPQFFFWMGLRCVRCTCIYLYICVYRKIKREGRRRDVLCMCTCLHMCMYMEGEREKEGEETDPACAYVYEQYIYVCIWKEKEGDKTYSACKYVCECEHICMYMIRKKMERGRRD